MASKKTSRRAWTSREDDLAVFLFRTPATAQQVFLVSGTWAQPFASLDRTYHRLSQLCQAGWVSRSPLAIAGRFGKSYYQLTLDGYRMWRCDPTAPPPTKRFFAPKGDAFHHHLYAKSQFLAHLTVVAHRRGFRIENDRPENTFLIAVGQNRIWPDHYCELVGPYGRRFRRFFEFDRSTEVLLSSLKQEDTWSQKNLVYDGYQTMLGTGVRFRVVPVTTASLQRLRNILSLFAVETNSPDRQLYVGVYLNDFLAEDDALCHPVFRDHRRPRVSLVPPCAAGLPPRHVRSALDSHLLPVLSAFESRLTPV